MSTKTDIRPYLIQRGKFTDAKREEIRGIDSLIKYEYMGSSHFEGGALGASLKRITRHLDKYALIKVDDLQDVEGNNLFVYCQDEKKDQVITAIKELAKDAIPLEEWILFHHHIDGTDWWRTPNKKVREDENFWWDIENDFMFCFTSHHGDLLKFAVEKWHKDENGG